MRKSPEGPCAFETCDRDAEVKGMCRAHYNQQHRGRPLTPLGKHNKFVSPVPGKRICTNCERMLDEAENFYTRTNGTYQSKCKDCARRYQREYQRAKKEQDAAV